MRVYLILALLFSIGSYLGCGTYGPEPTPTPKTIQTEGLTPTPIPTEAPRVATHTPSPTQVLPTPDIEATVTARVEAAMEALKQQATVEPTATLQPTPTPTRQPSVRYVPIPSAAQSILNVNSISISNDRLTLNGTVNQQGYSPSSIQVWQSQEEFGYSDNCSTDRPIAFIRSGSGSAVYSGQITDYTWGFCRGGYFLGEFTDPVPWLYSQSWSYNLRKRLRITDPYIYDFNMSASLDHELVKNLQYDADLVEGWRVVVFSGENIILNQWIER